ncbi:DUF1287 domain-containing protein [Luteolibacter algae]|uniref:DUF1287 domain-containing protein n=1 Tax=Luteolibacter algae TaxID=454151 RepID=A0ABW5D6I4_9BACT
MKKILLLFLVSVLTVCAGTGDAIVAAAKKQIGVTLSYDPAYATLAYPGGDVPREWGVCTDVVIRALRDGMDADLQKLVHEDMAGNFPKYPGIWGLKRPDRNIDHRRVPNLIVFFKRQHQSLPVSDPIHKMTFRPGDLVTCTVPPRLAHIMIISDRKNAKGLGLTPFSGQF